MPRQAGSRTERRVLRARRALKEIERQLAKLLARIKHLEQRKSPASRRARKKPTLSPGRRAALKLQGAYMGFTRQLGPRQKTRVKQLKAAKGYPAAIKLAKKLAGR